MTSLHLLFAVFALEACTPAVPRQPLTRAISATASPVTAKTSEPPIKPDETFRREPPAARQSAPYVPPPAVRASLENGISVVLVSSPSRYCSIKVVAVGGLADIATARPDKVDLVDQMLSSMNRGPVSKDKRTFEDRFRDLEMPFPSWSRFMDGVAFYSSVPKEHFAEAAELLAELVTDTGFAAPTFDRTREQDARLLDDTFNDVAKIAEQVLGRALFGSHVYGAVGSAAHRRAVTRADVVALHARLFRASRISIVVAGEIEPKEAIAALESSFGKAPGGGTKPPSAPVAVLAAGPTLVVVDRPGTNTAFVAAGFLGPSAAADEKLAAQMAANIAMNAVIGRGTRLRDELKLVPWTTAITWTWRSGGELGWRARTTSENVPTLLQEADRIANALATDGPTDDEVDAMRNCMASEVIGDFSTPTRIAGSYADLIDLGLPNDSILSIPTRVAATTAADVRAAAAKYLVRERMRVVVVGDLASLRDPLTRLGWGPIEVRDSSGEIIRASGLPGGSR